MFTRDGVVDVSINFEWLRIPTVTICFYLQINKNATTNTQYSIIGTVYKKGYRMGFRLIKIWIDRKSNTVTVAAK